VRRPRDLAGVHSLAMRAVHAIYTVAEIDLASLAIQRPPSPLSTPIIVMGPLATTAAAPVGISPGGTDVNNDFFVLHTDLFDDGALELKQIFDYTFMWHLSYPVFSFFSSKKLLGNSNAFFVSSP